jgi:membrane-bound lytic murein transglycosylase D
LIRRLTAEESSLAKAVTISGKYHSAVIARIILMDIADFNRYNPHFDKLIATPENSYELKLPADKMELFTANKYQILYESVQLLLSGDIVASATN